MKVQNQTPYNVTPVFISDSEGAENLVVIIKGTWKIGVNGTLSGSEKQMEVLHAPVYRGEPTSSSLIYESDVVLEKPGTDCVLIGHAYAQKPKTRQIDVTFAVGPVQKTVRVFGDRMCSRILGIKTKSKPAFFEKIPLIYENAFGGQDLSPRKAKHHANYAWNPVGRGFRAKWSKMRFSGTKLPNLVYPFGKKPADKSKAAGFGMIPVHWRPRCGYAGTYDAKTASIFPPADVDPRFSCSAGSGLTSSKHLQGNETVFVQHATPGGQLQFTLPSVRPKVVVCVEGKHLETNVLLDTVIVEPDEKRLQLVWRGKQNVHQRVNQVEWVQVKV